MMPRNVTRSTTDTCADCGTLEPSWASINRGVLVCDGCCSVHLSLGRHVSQIKSLKKGSWCPQQLTMVHQLVSSGANNIWEHCLLDPSQNRQGRRKPNPRDPIHQTKADFIRAKYQFLAFVNKHKDSDLVSIEDLSKQLHSSVRTANLETSLRLLSNGADPNYVHPEKGNTPLHIACQSGQASQAELLLVYGADPTAFDYCCKTPADVARSEGHIDMADRLVECQYELTDALAFYLCSRRPDHRAGQHFIIPEMADSSLDVSELAKGAKKKLQALANHLFEELAMDVYDELDRRENEAAWLSSVQSQGSMVVSDRHIVPFLPANPEFSATRNQGRQKLAKFNKREFATLIIDILNDAKRRYLKVLSPTAAIAIAAAESGMKPPRLSKDGRRSNNVPGGRASSLSDDEPLYDSVCSGDEDYASIGDNHSSKGEVTSSSNGATRLGGGREDGDDGSNGRAGQPVTVREYQELKQLLTDSISKTERLQANNASLTEDIAVLQTMVKKLVQENRLLRCGYSPVEVPSSVNGGLDVISSFLPPPPPDLSSSSSGPVDISSWVGVNTSLTGGGGISDSAGGAGVRGATRLPRWSMIEQGDPARRVFNHGAGISGQTPSPFSTLKEETSFATPGSARDLPSPPFELLGSGSKPIASVQLQSKSAPGSGAHLDSVNKSSSAENLPLSMSDNTLMSSGSQDAAAALVTDTAAGNSVVPTQDVVVKKTEKITKALQELFQSAQDAKHDRYVPCAEKIHAAVTEMSALFPHECPTAKIADVLQQLIGSANRLRDECAIIPPEVGGQRDYRSHTQVVIQSAYDIAKSAKQLVLLFE